MSTASPGARRACRRTAATAIARNSSSVISPRAMPTRPNGFGSAPSWARSYSAGSSLREARSPVAPKIAKLVGSTRSGASPSAGRSALDRGGVRMVLIDDRVDLARQAQLGEREAGVMEVPDRELHAVVLSDAHVGPAPVVDRRGADALDERQCVLEVPQAERAHQGPPAAPPPRMPG